jgi:hypothetical protein
MPNARGTANVTVKLHDNGGGTDTSDPVSFPITITKTHRLHNAAEAGPRNGRDVTDGSLTGPPDGKITAGDALAIVNYINSKGSGLIQSATPSPPYLDVDGDDQATATDVLLIVNYINAHPGQSEASDSFGESGVDPIAANTTPYYPSEAANNLAPTPAVNLTHSSAGISTDLLNLLAAEVATQFKRRRFAP